VAKLVINGFEPHPMSYCPHVPCFHIDVEIHLDGKAAFHTKVLVTYDDMFSIDEKLKEPGEKYGWMYGHSVHPKFDELDMQWKYRASEDVLKYAQRTIESSPYFQDWQRSAEVLLSGDRDTEGPDESDVD